MKRPFACMAVALTTVFGAACGGEEPELAALKQDPLAAFAPPGGRPEFTFEDEAGTAAGKPVYAMVYRGFSYDDPGEADAGRDAAIDAATASGWSIEPDPQLAYGQKTLDTGLAEIGIARVAVRGRFRVSIRLRHL